MRVRDCRESSENTTPGRARPNVVGQDKEQLYTLYYGHVGNLVRCLATDGPRPTKLNGERRKPQAQVRSAARMIDISNEQEPSVYLLTTHTHAGYGIKMAGETNAISESSRLNFRLLIAYPSFVVISYSFYIYIFVMHYAMLPGPLQLHE
jgi:hypothetical protein